MFAEEMAMGRDESDPWKRFRERRENLRKESPKASPTASSLSGRPEVASETASASVVQLIERIETLLEQVGSLYNQYFAGAEKLPPIERRKQLDQSIAQLQSAQKAMTADRFRANGTVARWKAYSDRWDRQLKLLEQGKITRRSRAVS